MGKLGLEVFASRLESRSCHFGLEIDLKGGGLYL